MTRTVPAQQMWSKLALLGFMLFMMIWGSPGAIAADNGDSTNSVKLHVEIGSDTMTVNGKAYTIQKPYIDNRKAFVPLKVITTAFGAALKWDGATQTIDLAYASHKVTLKIGSLQAAADGKKVTLQAPPKIVNNTTMVPLKFITDAFDADLQWDGATQEITITGVSLHVEPQKDESGINADSGKTKIGDSYYGWSIEYPSDMEMTDQESKGSFVELTDLNEKYYIDIITEDGASFSLSDEALLRQLSDKATGVQIERKTEQSGTFKYAKIIARADGYVTEYRACLSGGRMYTVTLTVEEQTYENEPEYQAYLDLLGSFNLSYTGEDADVIDIAMIKNGYYIYTNEDYGLSFKAPADWDDKAENKGVYLSGPNNEEWIRVEMTSLGKDDSLEKWEARETKSFTDLFLPNYREIGELGESLIVGTPVLEREMSYSYGTQWRTLHTVYMVKDGYKFDISLEFPRDKSAADKDKLLRTVMDSFSINILAIREAFGTIQDQYDSEARSRVTNKDEGYSLEVPDQWDPTESNGVDGTTEYQFSGGSFGLYPSEELSFDEGVNTIEAYIRNKESEDDEYHLISSMETALLGSPAHKFVVSAKDSENDPYQVETYVFTLGGQTYFADLLLYDATHTAKAEQLLNDVLRSLKAD